MPTAEQYPCTAPSALSAKSSKRYEVDGDEAHAALFDDEEDDEEEDDDPPLALRTPNFRAPQFRRAKNHSHDSTSET